MKNKYGVKKVRLTYKHTVLLCLLGLMSVFVGIFVGFTYYNYQQEAYENAKRESQDASNRIVLQVDERLNNLQQYYTSAMLGTDIEWMLENTVHYSDYSRYSAATETMASKKIFWDYINGYALINFRSEIILSNKGMYPLKDAYNQEDIYTLYNSYDGIQGKSFWLFNADERLFSGGVSTIDKNDRCTVDMQGLNLMMKLPLDALNVHGMLVVNINMDTWEKWLEQWLDDYEDIVVLDAAGNLIYATDSELSTLLLDGELGELTTLNNDTLYMFAYEGEKYMPSMGTSDILGWQYYVFYNMEEGQKTAIRLSEMLLILFAIVLILCFFVIFYVIYRPIKRLMRDLSDESQSIEGNELDYLANRFANLKNDKQSLEHLLGQQQDRLQELFELRLIRGEVRSDDELDEYLSDLHLAKYKYYATAVMVLNLYGEEETQSNVNEDAICLALAEELPDNIKKYSWMPLVYNACTLFCIFGNDDEDELLTQITSFYKDMQAYSERACGYRILMGVSATHTDYRHMRAAYRESVNALTMQSKAKVEETRILLGGEHSEDCTSMEDCHFYLASSTINGSTYNNSFEKDIQTAIKALDKEQCYKVTDEFSLYLNECENHDEAMIYILRYVNTIMLTALDARVDLNALYPDGLKKVYREIIEAIEPSRVRRYIKRYLIDEILAARNQLLENSSYSMMEEIERKIVETRGNITLAECAESLGVHTTYIWKVLKMEKGKSFSDYLEEYKLNEAKRLLLQTNLSVADIAAELNYTNAQNFIRFFSKGTGVTPGKFRKLY